MLWDELNQDPRSEIDIITDYFGNRIGRFLDIGAWDCFNCSNTYNLSQKGWEGVVVEPSPIPLSKCLERYSGNDKITIVQAAIVPQLTDRISVFFESGQGGPSSTVLPAWQNAFKDTYAWQTMYVTTVDIKEFIQKFPGPYDFISVDAEGLSALICMEMDFQNLKTEFVCCEVEHFDKLYHSMESKGFSFYARTGANAFFRRQLEL